MEKLNLPAFSYCLKKHEGRVYIWDIVRKKYLLLKPEEWVRQHFVHFLIGKGYPKSLINIEASLIYNKLKKRSDILVCNRRGIPFLLVECKAPKTCISNKTFWQAATYNLAARAPYLCVTNGMQHYYTHIDFQTQNYHFLNDLPEFI